MYLNKVTLIGNLTRDVELKATPNGQKVASFSLATNRTWKDNNGAKQESVEYHNIVSFGKQAEVIAQYCVKGNQILVEGRLQTRSWDDKTTNEKKYRTEIVLESFQFGNNSKTEVKQETKVEDHTAIDPDTGVDLNAEDIPF